MKHERDIFHTVLRPRSRLFLVAVLVVFVLMIGLSGCNRANRVALTPDPTKTPRPTFTPVRLVIQVPTETPVPPTPTEVPPTPTQGPTATPGPTATQGPTATATPTPDPRYNPLTGLKVEDEAMLHRRPIHARIGNDTGIRPQEGLGAADVVYEDIMDGWALTRFTAVFLSEDPPCIRPLRSARLVNLELAPQYDAALVHTGASDRIRWMLSQSTICDLDEFFHPQPYSILKGYDWRGRFYTDPERVHAYLKKQGKELDALKPGLGFEFSQEGEPAPTGTVAESAHIPLPKLCVVDWKYDAEQGVYLRWVANEPHLDGNTGQQIAVSNVIIQYAAHEATDIVEDSLGNTAIRIVLQGEGPVQICRDGVMIEGKWQRHDLEEFTRFVDADGQPIPLKPGKTWVQFVPLDYELEFK